LAVRMNAKEAGEEVRNRERSGIVEVSGLVV